MIKPNAFFRHYKGGVYQIDDIITNPDAPAATRVMIVYHNVNRTDPAARYFRYMEDWRYSTEDGQARFEFLPNATKLWELVPGYSPVNDVLFPVYNKDDIELYFKAYSELTGKETAPDQVVMDLASLYPNQRSYYPSGKEYPAVIVNVRDTFTLIPGLRIDQLSHSMNTRKHIRQDPIALLNNNRNALL